MHSVHSKGTRSQTFNLLYEPSLNNNVGKRTFHMRAVKLWNNLPANICNNFNNMSVSQLKGLLFPDFCIIFPCHQ